MIDEYRYAPAKFVQAADRLLEMKKTKSVWEVIDEVLKVWESLQVKEYQSFLISHKDILETRKTATVGGSEFSGVSKDKGTGGMMAYTLDMPERVVRMIRIIYNADELPMDKKFYQKFARRYPQFRVLQKKG